MALAVLYTHSLHHDLVVLNGVCVKLVWLVLRMSAGYSPKVAGPQGQVLVLLLMFLRSGLPRTPPGPNPPCSSVLPPAVVQQAASLRCCSCRC